MVLPFSVVKRIAKLDDDVHLVSQEAVRALATSCEMFIRAFAQHAHQQSTFGKRKTIQLRDVQATIKTLSEYSFLEGVLESWEESPAKEDVPASIIETITEEIDPVIQDDDVIETITDENDEPDSEPQEKRVRVVTDDDDSKGIEMECHLTYDEATDTTSLAMF